MHIYTPQIKYYKLIEILYKHQEENTERETANKPTRVMKASW